MVNVLLCVEIDEEASTEIARRSRGTPRIANRLLKRVRDYAMVVAPINVNGGKFILIDFAVGPFPIIMSKT